MKNFITTSLLLACIFCFVDAKKINVPADQPSIQAGIDASSQGDTVLVAEGRYYENINFNGKAITLASNYLIDENFSHISNTIIDGSQSGSKDTASVVILVSGEDTTSVLTGFTVTGGKGTFWDSPFSSFTGKGNLTGGGIFINLSGGKITNNIIEDNHLILPTGGIKYSPDSLTEGAGIGAIVYQNNTLIIRDNIIRNNSCVSDNMANGGGMMVAGAGVIIERNQIHNNSCRSQIGMANGGGIAYFALAIEGDKGEVLIRNNCIHNNELTSIKGNSTPVSIGGALYLDGYNLPLEFKIHNNLVYRNSTNGGGGAIGTERGRFELINNTLVTNRAWDKGNSLYLRNKSTIILINNILWDYTNNGKEEIYITYNKDNKIYSFYNAIKGVGNGDPTNINTDPLVETDSFKLTEGSPCINSGVDSIKIDGKSYFAPSSDYNCRPRPCHHELDTRVDIGAKEFKLTTGIFDSKNYADKINIFPNPSVYNFTVETNDGQAISRIEILGMDGRIVRVENHNPGNQVTINRDVLPSGMYILRIHTGEIHVKKIMIE